MAPNGMRKLRGSLEVMQIEADPTVSSCDNHLNFDFTKPMVAKACKRKHFKKAVANSNSRHPIHVREEKRESFWLFQQLMASNLRSVRKAGLLNFSDANGVVYQD